MTTTSAAEYERIIAGLVTTIDQLVGADDPTGRAVQEPTDLLVEDLDGMVSALTKDDAERAFAIWKSDVGLTDAQRAAAQKAIGDAMTDCLIDGEDVWEHVETGYWAFVGGCAAFDVTDSDQFDRCDAITPAVRTGLQAVARHCAGSLTRCRNR